MLHQVASSLYFMIKMHSQTALKFANIVLKMFISIRLSVDSDFNLLFHVILYRRAILKRILWTNPFPMWTGFIWFRTFSRCGLLLTLTLIINVIKREFMTSPTHMGFSLISLLPLFQQCQFRALQFSRRRKFTLRLVGCDAMLEAVYGPTYNELTFLHFCV